MLSINIACIIFIGFFIGCLFNDEIMTSFYVREI